VAGMSRRAVPKANSTAAEGEGTPVSRRAVPKANSTAPKAKAKAKAKVVQ